MFQLSGTRRLRCIAAVALVGAVVLAGCSSNGGTGTAAPNSSAVNQSSTATSGAPSNTPAATGNTSASSPAGAGGHPTLSMSKVAMLASSAGDATIMYSALKEGYFADEGLDVDLETSGAAANAPSSARLAAFFSGSYQFINQASGSSILARQAGGEITAVFGTSISGSNQMNIDMDTATKLGVPTNSDTPDAATAAFLKLKGSHITVGVGSTTSNNYFGLLAACKEHGLTCGVDQTSADIDVKVVGSNESATAGMKAGRYQALMNGGLNSVIPNTAVIQMGDVNPLLTAANFDVSTSPAMIKDHPDTVQAMVNALVRGWQYVKSNPAGAEKHYDEMVAESGVTDQAAMHQAFLNYVPYWVTPLLLKDAYQNQLTLLEDSGQGNVTVSYDQFNDPSFVDQAVKELGVDVPTAVPGT